MVAASKRIPVPPARPHKPRAAAPKPPEVPPVEIPAAPVAEPTPRKRIVKGDQLRVLIAGGSGMIGTELRKQLEAAGHTVKTLVRREPATESEFSWAPDAKILDFRLLESVDAVVNLSGASLNRLPWTPGYKNEILRSRIKATQALVEAMSMASSPPQVFISGSAVGIYGDRPGERLTEEASRGSGFLADVVDAWETAANLSPEKTRTVNLRTGLVIGPAGATTPLRLLTKLGLGSRLGAGDQNWAWVSLHDEVAAIVHLLSSDISGPVNVVGPTPATADQITARLARDLKRPYRLKVPERIIELTLQDAGRELLLASQKAAPSRLMADGFVFRDETSDEAVDAYAG